MSTSVDKLAKELEKIYENSCVKEAVKAGNLNCLALDEQELAIMYMCLEGLEEEDGININNYTSKGLFILLKNRDLGKSECKHNRVKNEPLKYKRSESSVGYLLERMDDYLLVYYAVLLFYANNKNTRDDYRMELNRAYFIIYAYFACICPKTFNILFFNQIHLFMSKAHKHLSPEELRYYLENTEELWKAYNYLLSSSNRIDILANVITQYEEIMSCDEKIFYESMVQIYNLSEEGFLAFDFKNLSSGDTLREYRFKIILDGIEYFRWYLIYLEKEILKQSFREENLTKIIHNILRHSETLEKIFEDLLKKEDGKRDEFVREFDNISQLLKKFYKYCDGKVTLIKI